jgi:hypothetical protein
MTVPVIAGDDGAYFVGRVDLLHLNCGPNSESFGVRYRFGIPVIHEQLGVLHRHFMLLGGYLGLDICVGWTNLRMRTEIWYGNLLIVISSDENEEVGS